ncbi:MAG: serine/threonine-protein kinase [Myxococcota bacterium]|jgi:serine/threonine protein kinase|nr:serine/threonine-protein kinase [Myxococcota bacterium]
MFKPQSFGPYQLVKHIASGGMAEIYLAKTAGIAGFEKLLAVKMIRENLVDDEEFVDMLVAEAKIAVLLNHPNIVQVFDLGLVNERYYIAMEYVDGQDLHNLLVKTAELDDYIPFPIAAYIIKEACAGLYYAHQRNDSAGQPLNIVHRDISPQNILLGFDGEVKLADFGIAKANVARNETQVGIIKGKFCYMSPEQAWGDRLDARSDVFSLGVVLYEMLTGRMIYEEQDQIRLLELVRRTEIPPPSHIRPEIPSALEAIVMQALERDRQLRFQTAADFQRELAHYLANHAPTLCAADISDYLRRVFRNEPAEAEEKTVAPAREVSVETRNVRLSVMERTEFVPDEAASLVYSFNALNALSKGNRRPDQETAAVRLRPGSAPRFEVEDDEPTVAYLSDTLQAVRSGMLQEQGWDPPRPSSTWSTRAPGPELPEHSEESIPLSSADVESLNAPALRTQHVSFEKLPDEPEALPTYSPARRPSAVQPAPISPEASTLPQLASYNENLEAKTSLLMWLFVAGLLLLGILAVIVVLVMS